MTMKFDCLCIITGTYWKVKHVVRSCIYCSYFF